MNGKRIVRFPFRSLREASRPSARESDKFLQHRWQVSSKMASKTSSKMTSLKRPLVSRSTPLQVLGVRYTIQWPACCESKKRASLWNMGGSIWCNMTKKPHQKQPFFWGKSGKNNTFLVALYNYIVLRLFWDGCIGRSSWLFTFRFFLRKLLKNWPHQKMIRRWWFFEIRRENQLRLVVYPINLQGLYIPGGCLGFSIKVIK